MIRRLLAGFVLVLLGLAVGVLGGFVQAMRTPVPTPWGMLVLPWGAVLAVVVLLVLVRGATWWLHSRAGGWLLLGGWLVATFAAATASPSGDLAISSGARQWAYVLTGVVLGAASATFPTIGASSPTIDDGSSAD